MQTIKAGGYPMFAKKEVLQGFSGSINWQLFLWSIIIILTLFS